MIDQPTIYQILRDITRFFALIMLCKYTLFLLVAPIHKVKESLRKLHIAKSKKIFTPLVSVLIPAWNEEVGILSTVISILNNSYPHIEVIVVNDGSTDRTGQIVKDFIKKKQLYFRPNRKSVVYRAQPNGGKGAALNQAIKLARGEIIVTVDADSIADQKMIEKLVSYFADPKVDEVVGNVKIAGEVTLINLLQKLEYLLGFYHKRAHSLLGAEYIYGGACASFRKSKVFNKIGHFDEGSITEDIEMSLRTRYHGHYAVFADDAICYTEGAHNVLGLMKQRLRWKKGRFEAFGKYKRLFLSTKKHHNRWLTWFILPFAIFGEIELLFEPIGLTLLFVYSYITGDYSSLVLSALFIGIIYIMVGLFTEKGKNAWMIIVWPFTWMIFYLLVIVEYMALMKSIGATFRSEAVSWQTWHRKGIAVKRKVVNGVKQ